MIANILNTQVEEAGFTEEERIERVKRAAQKVLEDANKTFVQRNKECIVDWLKALVFFGVYSAVGILVYQALEPDWSAIDAFYFCMMTMSTVGYGDISPSTDWSRGFTLAMIFIGIIFVFTAVSNAIGHFSGPITNKGRELMEELFPQVGVDLSGNGQIDYYKPRPPAIYYAKNLLPSLLLSLIVQLIFSAFFTLVTGDSTATPPIEPWSFGIAFYHCLVTATTVGCACRSALTAMDRAAPPLLDPSPRPHPSHHPCSPPRFPLQRRALLLMYRHPTLCPSLVRRRRRVQSNSAGAHARCLPHHRRGGARRRAALHHRRACRPARRDARARQVPRA